MADSFQAGLEVGHGPGLSGDVAVESVVVIYTKTGALQDLAVFRSSLSISAVGDTLMYKKSRNTGVGGYGG